MAIAKIDSLPDGVAHVGQLNTGMSNGGTLGGYANPVSKLLSKMAIDKNAVEVTEERTPE